MSTPEHRSRTSARSLNAVLWGLLAAAVALRCTSLELMEFKGDELGFLVDAYENSRSPGAVLTLPSSAGLRHPALLVWLLTPALWFTRDPVAVTAVVVAANVIGLGLYYGFLRRAFGRGTALWGTTLFASLPWGSVLSRKLWNPDLIFPFVAGFLWLLAELLHRPRPWKVVATCAALGLACQVHLSVWGLVPLLVVYLWWTRARLPVRPLALGLTIAALLFVPYVVGSLTGEPPIPRADADNPLGVRLARSGTSLARAFGISTGLGYEYLLGRDPHAQFLASDPLLRLARGLFLAAAVAMVAGLGWLAARAWRDLGALRRGEQREVGRRVTAWLVVAFVGIALGYFLLDRELRPHQAIVLAWPILPLALALGLRTAAAARHPGLAWLPGIALVALVSAHLYHVQSFRTFLREHPKEVRGDYGRPYFQTRARWTAKLEEACARVDAELAEARPPGAQGD